MTSVAVRPWAPAAVTASTRSSVTSGSTIAVISFTGSSSRTRPAASLGRAPGRGQGRRSAGAGSTVPAAARHGPWPVAGWGAARSPVGEHYPDLAWGEGHPLAGGRGVGGAGVGVWPGPVGGPGLPVAQHQG